MSNNDIIKENNKKLFESRLQMTQNSSLKMNQIFLKANKKKLKNKTNLYLFNTDIFQNDNSQSKRKTKLGIDNSLNNFLKKNISAGKNQKKINKNRNKNNYLNINNKSNLIIKDISFFHTKNSTLKNDFQIINVNKKGSTNFNISKKIKEKKSNSHQKRNKKIKNVLNIKIKNQKKFNQDKYSKSFLDFNCDNNNYKKQKNPKSKIFLLGGISTGRRNNSSTKKDGNIYNSFLVQKIKIIKKKKKPYLNNINFINKSIRTNLLNKTGKNIKDSFYQNCNEKYVRNTYRNLFIRKGFNSTNKNSFINLNYNTNANHSSILNNKKKISERNLKVKNINRLTLNPVKSKISKNKINDICLIAKLKMNINNNLQMNHSKNTKTTNEIKLNQSQNNNNIINNQISKINKYIDKKEEIVDDFNIKSTKTNDDVFTESKNEKIEESSIEEESGVLSMNEIEDIIIYNNMKNINKDDNYLFYKNDYYDFIKENKDKILFLFFDINNKTEEKINKEIKTKINLEKKSYEINKEKSNIKNKNKLQNKPKEFKMLSYNNSIRMKKLQFSHK
jgi:hypothetical protein